MGDSITEGWKGKHPDFFAAAGRVCRGISGQTTPQMVLRMMADVVHLKPKAVHIMAGTNAIAGNTGPMPPAPRPHHPVNMNQLGQASGLTPLPHSLPPADGFPWAAGMPFPPPTPPPNHRN